MLDINQPLDTSLASHTEGLSKSQWTEYLTSVVVTGRSLQLDGISFPIEHGDRFFQVLLIPLMEEAGQAVTAGIAVFQDVSENHQLARELETVERAATLGKLTSTVAHELNGPLDGVLRYLNLAQRQLEKQDVEKAMTYLQQCREGLQRMVQIVAELLEYSRGVPIPLQTYRLEQLVEEAIKTVEAKWTGPVMEIRRSYESDIPLIRRGNLFQVFCNIIKNAYDAMPTGGRLDIQGAITEDSVLAMTFRDRGHGFSLKDMNKVFVPFFTTKSHGTGLGLAVCKDIVQRYKGQIDARNAEDGGAVITLHLPLAEIC